MKDRAVGIFPLGDPARAIAPWIVGGAVAMERFDSVILGGDVVDGTGAPRRRADIGIAGDRIAAIGDLAHAVAGARIDAAGRCVAPGFIDAHTHDDNIVFGTPDMAMKVSQGVTTVIAGNCGVSLAPLTLAGPPPPPLDLLGDRGDYRFARFADYMAAIEAAPPATNIAAMVGHATLRARTCPAAASTT